MLVLEKGRRFELDDFPETNWDVKRWMWNPALGMRGFFQMSFFDHVTVLHGVGVGGGSLTYANTLPMPSEGFYQSSSWSHLADWERELAPHYATARRMLGATPYRETTESDRIVREIATDIGREEHFDKPHVGVFFGEPDVRVPDPYFGGEGPDRVGCTHCGACMTGCRVGAKNTLDRNYLYLAEKRGAEVRAETEVTAVRPRSGYDGEGGYSVETRSTKPGDRTRTTVTADKVIFAGGVMGTIPLLLRMKEDPHGLPRLSDRLGKSVRTNNESLIGVICPDEDRDFSEGVAITSILHTDEHSHLEPVRYGGGSGFFRTMCLPYSPGANIPARLFGTARGFARHPILWSQALSVHDFARRTVCLLYMQTLDSTLELRLGRSWLNGFRRDLVSALDPSQEAPKAFMDEAGDLAQRFADKVGGVPMTLLTEALLGVPSTAHILGGACMGESAAEGVIDARHRVHGYDGLFVIDGSAVSANPGVNPSLTITALAERAMAMLE